MAEGTSNSGRGGIGFVGLLQIVFITLKLTGYIAWSWWWVLSPTWISAILLVVLLAVCIPLVVIAYRAERRRK